MWLKKNVKAEKINLVSNSEPEVRIVIEGLVVDSLGTTKTNKLIYVYHTSSEGWYSGTAAHILQHKAIEDMHTFLGI